MICFQPENADAGASCTFTLRMSLPVRVTPRSQHDLAPSVDAARAACTTVLCTLEAAATGQCERSVSTL